MVWIATVIDWNWLILPDPITLGGIPFGLAASLLVPAFQGLVPGLAIDGPGPHTILDFGCGPGRDLVAITEFGHVAVGLEGSEVFARMAQDLSRCEVLRQNSLSLDLPAGRFDGIFANASLFHVPCQELPPKVRPRNFYLECLPDPRRCGNSLHWCGASRKVMRLRSCLVRRELARS